MDTTEHTSSTRDNLFRNLVRELSTALDEAAHLRPRAAERDAAVAELGELRTLCATVTQERDLWRARCEGMQLAGCRLPEAPPAPPPAVIETKTEAPPPSEEPPEKEREPEPEPEDDDVRIVRLIAEHPDGLQCPEISRALGLLRSRVAGRLPALAAEGRLVRTGGLRGPSVRYSAPLPVTPAAPPPPRPVEESPAPVDPAVALAAAEAALSGGDWREADRVARAALDGAGAGHIGQTLGAAATEKRSQLLIEALRLQVQGTTQETAAEVEGTEAAVGAEAPLVLLVGGIGRMEARYRAAVEGRGLRLLYIEASQAKMRKLSARPDAVMIFTTVVSHPLRLAAAALAEQQQIPIHYIQEPSQSSLRRGLDALGFKSAEATAAT